jgi:diguanylate cyclase (GGDEF)-like protein
MLMDLEIIDTPLLSNIQDSISEITDLSFSAYDSSGALLTVPKKEDRLIAQIKSYASGREEYERFIRDGIEKAILRKETFIIKGVANQHHLFIPIDVNGFKLVLVSSPFYFIRTEFEDFLIKKGEYFGFLLPHLESWLETINFKDYPSVQKISVHIKSLFETFLQGSYEKNLNRRRYQMAKTMIDLTFNTQLPVPVKDFYSSFLDAILFLFSVDTVSVMVKEKNFFKTAIASGRLQDDVRTLRIKEDNPRVIHSIEGFIPEFTNDVMEIARLGFPESITSLHIFPLLCRNNTYSIAVIYNSVLSREESYSILEFCKLSSLALKNLFLQNIRENYANKITALNTAVTKLTPKLHNLDILYETIVDTAAELLRSEKGSLMVPDEDYLLIKAVKGINKWLIQDIRIKIGAEIAGMVFKDGEPLLVKDIAKARMPSIKPKSHYKTGSFVSVPMKFASETIGVLNISDKTTGEEFTEQDMDVLNYFSSHASIALKTSNYYNMAEKMKELSIKDHLTGIFNKRYLQERFEEEIHRSERYDLVFSFAIFDIDYFKIFNDTEGHLAGDNVLKGVARIAHGCLRANDIVARFGGEEFAVLMPQTDNKKKEAFVVAERIRENIRASLTRKWENFPYPSITVSIGIASFPDDGRSMDELIESADKALYKAKALGKDRTVIFKKED